AVRAMTPLTLRFVQALTSGQCSSIERLRVCFHRCTLWNHPAFRVVWCLCCDPRDFDSNCWTEHERRAEQRPCPIGHNHFSPCTRRAASSRVQLHSVATSVGDSRASGCIMRYCQGAIVPLDASWHILSSMSARSNGLYCVQRDRLSCPRA